MYLVLSWSLNRFCMLFDKYGPVNPCKFSMSLHLYCHISHISHMAILWLFMIEQAPPLHHHPFAGYQFPKFKVSLHYLWLPRFSLASSGKKNWTILLQIPPSYRSLLYNFCRRINSRVREWWIFEARWYFGGAFLAIWCTKIKSLVEEFSWG